MLRWLFLVLVAANAFPFLLAGNDSQDAPGPSLQRGQTGAPGNAGVKPVVLLSEQGGRPPQAEGPGDNGNLLPQRRDLRCFLIGPLTSMATVEQYAPILEDAGVAISRRWREVVIGSDFWVYLPAMLSSRATTRALQELKASGIEGFIFSEGELKGAIAIGVFTNQVAAEQRRAQLAEWGYDARLHKMDRLAREYWMMSEEVPRPAIMLALSSAAGDVDIPQKISRMDCKTVASAMHFQ